MREPRDTTGNDALDVCPNCDTPRVIGRHGSSDCIVALRAARERWRLNATEAYDERDRFRRERDDAYALIRHYADTDPEVALAERMRPVVEAAKACADCDCESPRHDDDGNLFLPKGGYPCAWDCPHLEGLLDAVDAFRVATSEQEASDCTTCGGTGEEEFAIPGTDHDTMMGDCTDCKASEQEASGHAS